MTSSLPSLAKPSCGVINGHTSPTMHGFVDRSFLDSLIDNSLVLMEDWAALPTSLQMSITNRPDRESMLKKLVEHGLLTDYQANRIEAGTTFGLRLGSYRVLDRIGAGAMGIVFRGEHILMRRPVAIKVLPFSPHQDERLLQRFLTEIRIIAQLNHPNIVAAFDAGEVSNPNADGAALHFFVMEHVTGQDLEEFVIQNGPLSCVQAANMAYQVASALAEANKHKLIHRDVKPSNILITSDGQAKLLDFGLARNFQRNVTEPGVLIGTVEYMAPEQAEDAHNVDIRADLFSLGGVLFWALTGESPFLSTGNFIKDLTSRIQQRPVSVRDLRPDVPQAIDDIVLRLAAVDPQDRYPDPESLMRVLRPFLKAQIKPGYFLPISSTTGNGVSIGACPTDSGLASYGDPESAPLESSRVYKVMVVDDEPKMLTYCQFILQSEQMECHLFTDGEAALRALEEETYDLVLLDIHMPGIGGKDICRRLRELPTCQTVKVLMMSGDAYADTMAEMLQGEADDFLTKPFSLTHLKSRVRSALRLKDSQDHNEQLRQHLFTVNAELENNLAARDSDLVRTRNALVLALANLVERRASESINHLLRLQRYSRILTEEMARSSPYSKQVSQQFIDLLECCVPLHDIGKAGLPDHILLKPGKLDADERILMQSHTIIGAEMLEEIAQHHPSSLTFLRQAIEIVRSHHERFDGQGYPDRLAGTGIPLAARIVSICDVYDALRSRRVYKPALAHAAAMQVVLEGSPGQFDPVLMQIFQRCATQFEAVYRDNPN